MTGPHPAVAAVRSAVRADLADLAGRDGALVLVACSGGPDSLALAAATAFVAPRSGLRAGAVVVDHGLQAGSAAVAERALAQCRDLGLDPVVLVTLEPAQARGGQGADVQDAGGPEAAARTARHAALATQAQALGAGAVLLGHTRDDQAETVLLRLSRGSGARSLAGMPARRGVLRRPLLAVTRQQTEAVCTALGLDPWQDPTNHLPDDAGPGLPLAAAAAAAAAADDDDAGHGPGVPLRSQVRWTVLPVLEQVLGPGVRASLARSAELLREDADALDVLAATLFAQSRRPADSLAADSLVAGSLAAERLAGDGPPGDSRAEGSAVIPDPPGAVVVDVQTLGAALPAVRRRALRLAALAAGAADGDLARTHVLALDALVTAWSGQGPVHLPAGVRALRRYGRLILAPGNPEEQQREPRRDG